MLQEVLFVKKLAYELANGLDKAVAIVITQDLGPPGLTPNEIGDFASHIGRWRIDKAAKLGTPMWQRGITMFVFWVQQFYHHSNKKPGETLLQVCKPPRCASWWWEGSLSAGRRDTASW